MIAVAVWKEAGFFMIFYLAALQTMPTDLREAAALEGSSRLNYFRRVTIPLLMPTTLFVMVNAVINAFRVIDHIVVMTRGGPDNATTLLLYYIYETGFRFWDTATAAALTVVLLAILGLTAWLQFGVLGPPDPLPMIVADQHWFGRTLETTGAWMLGILWLLPLLYAVWTAFHPAAYATRFDLFAPLTFDNLAAAWHAAPFSRYLLNTVMLVTLILAVQFVLCTLAAFAFARLVFPGRDLLFGIVLLQLMVMPDVLLVENYHTLVQLHLVDTILAIALAVPRLGVRHLPVAPDVHDHSATVGRRRQDGGLRLAGPALASLRAVGETNLHRLRPGAGQLPLEQLSLAADHHQFGHHAAVDGRPVGIRHHRSGHRLVNRHRGDPDDQRAVAGGVPVVPAPVRAELHARRHSLNPTAPPPPL